MHAENSMKKCIKEALLRLMKDKSVEQITAVELAKEAGVSRASFYRYYDSIDDVLIEMEDDIIEGMRDCSRYYISQPFDINRLDEPYPAFLAITEYIYKNKEYFLSLTGVHGDRRFVRKWHSLLKEFYAGKLSFEGIRVQELDFYIEFVIGGNDSTLHYWLEKRPDLSVEKITLITQKLLFAPFAPQ